MYSLTVARSRAFDGHAVHSSLGSKNQDKSLGYYFLVALQEAISS